MASWARVPVWERALGAPLHIHLVGVAVCTKPGVQAQILSCTEALDTEERDPVVTGVGRGGAQPLFLCIGARTTPTSKGSVAVGREDQELPRRTQAWAPLQDFNLIPFNL